MDLSLRRRAAIVFVSLAAFLFSPLDYSILEPALPAIQRAYAINEQNISWTYTIYSIALMIGTPLIAKWSDARGRRNAFVLTMTIFAAGTLICALAPSYLILLAGRAVQGFGGGGIAPIIAAVIGENVSASRRGTVLSLMGVVVGIGLLAGPIIGNLAVQVGWQNFFLAFVPAMLLLGALGYWLMPPTQHTRKPLDARGIILLSVTVTSFIYGLVQIQPNNFFGSLASLNVFPFLLAALILLYLLIRAERHAASPLLPVMMLRERQILLASSLAVGYGFARTALAFLPELASTAFREPVNDIVALLLPVAISIIIASLAAGALVDRIGTKLVVVTGLVALTLGIFCFAFFPSNELLFLSGGVLCGIGSAVLVGAPVRYIFLNEFPTTERGAGQGLFGVMWAFGQQVSGIVIGSLLAAHRDGLAGYTTAYLVMAGVMVLLLIGASGLKGQAAEKAGAN